jgi:hypothetical protein
MTRSKLLPLACLAVIACSDDAPEGNPDKVWLYLDGSETQVQLVAFEPDPY